MRVSKIWRRPARRMRWDWSLFPGGTRRRGSVVLAIVGLSALLASVNGGAAEKGSRLAAWYRFEETSGSTVNDRSGNHNEGEIVGPYTRSATERGLKLSGTSYVRIPSSTSLALSRNFSVAVWFAGQGE